jgi:flavin-dependent dehydrogenase
VEVIFGKSVDGLMGNLNCPLNELIIEGVRSDGTDYPADLVIDASGRDGNLRKMAGCGALIAKEMGKAKSEAFRTVRRYKDGSVPFNFIDHYRYGAHQGYFWIHFHDEGIVDIGGGMPFGGGIREKVLELVRTFPNVTDEELRGGGGVLYLNEPPPTLVAGGFMVVGDSGGQLNPTNGCGVGSAWIGALSASRVAAQAKDFSVESLWPYNKAWFSGRGAHYAALNAVKNMLQELSHDEVAMLMKFNILSGELLTNNLNGIFAPSTVSESLRALGLLFRSPPLLSKLMKANAAGKKTFTRYMHYPEFWDEAAFNAWCATG